jgi:hypothetical protein
MTATTDDGGQPVLLMPWNGGGGAAVDRDAYLRNTPRWQQLGNGLGDRWNKTRSRCRSGSIGRASDDRPVKGSSSWCGIPTWSDPRRMTSQP